MIEQWEWTWQVSDRAHQVVDDGLDYARQGKREAERQGNTWGAENFAHQIQAWEQLAVQIKQRDRAAREQYARDYQQWADRDRYTRTRNSLWAVVLQWARVGELPAGWRELLPGYHARTAEMFGDKVRDDIDGLVLHEFATLPPQLWEPHHAGGDWRAALDAWYRDSLALRDRTHREREELHTSKPEPFKLPIKRMTETAIAARCAPTRNVPLDAEFTHALRQADAVAAQAVNRVRGRDRLEAWYRAGLVAGGEPGDWAGWYRDQIESTWEPRHDAAYGAQLIAPDEELAQLDDPATAAIVGESATGGWRAFPMQHLPDYWRR